MARTDQVKKRRRLGALSVWLVALACAALVALGGCAAPAAPTSGSAPLASTEAPDASADNALVARFIDVGQGDCALISCDGQWLLVDGGPSKASSTVYAILKRLGVTHLDHVISTHPDADHCGGLSGALEIATCGTFYSPTTESDTKTWASLTERLARTGTPITIPAPGDAFALGSATVTFLGPVRASSEDNNNSLVIRIDHAGNALLLTGDAERAEEADLISSGVNLRADVLKVGHHGSAGASSAPFLAAVAPRYAVISVGKNSYGHPTDDVLDRLAAQQAQVLRTDQEGDIVVTSTIEGIAVTAKGSIDE